MRGYRLSLLAVATFAAALVLAGGSALAYGPAPLSTWVASGGSLGGAQVNSVAVSGSTAYMAGNFSYLGPETGSGVAFDTTGALNPSWPQITGSVYAIVSDTAGTGWYVGGDFHSIGTAHYDNLVHIKNDGTIDTAWQVTTTYSPNGPVYALLLSAGGTLYAGGSFTKAGNTDRSRVAAFTASTGALVSGFSADVTGSGAAVRSMTIFGTDLYIGGFFSAVGATARNNVAKLSTSTGALDSSWNPNANGTVFALATSGSDIYAGGIFNSIGGQSRAGLAQLDDGGTGAADASWNPNPNPGAVYSLAASGTLVYVGGAFGTIGGQNRTALAAINTSGVENGNATSWNPGSNFTLGATAIYRLLVPGDGNVYAGGFFQVGTGGNSSSRDNVAVFNATSGAMDSFNPIVGGPVYALALSGTKLGAGGQFATVGSQVVRRNNLGAIDLTTGQATSWAPYANNTVNSIAISGTSLYAAGIFDMVSGGFPRNRLAAFDTSSGGLLDWDPGLLSGIPNVIAVFGSTIYVGGTEMSILDFNTGDPVTRKGLASIDTDGFVTGFDPNLDNEVNALAISGSTVYAGGQFTTANNGAVARNHIAAFNATTSTATTFDPDVDGGVNALALSPTGATLYAGGSFTHVDGSAIVRWGAAAFETGAGSGGEFRPFAAHNPGDPTTWDPHLEKLNDVSGTVNTIATPGTVVYLGGDFDYIGDCPGSCLQGAAGAVTSTTGAGLSAWLPEPNATVNSIALGQEGVAVGGLFTAVGYPRPGATFQATESGAAARGAFAAFRGLPEPPSNVAASPRDGGATIAFTAPSFTGGLPLTYTVTRSPGGQQTTGIIGSPVDINGLTNGVEYTFTITATNSVGTSQAVSSNSVTPNPAPVAPGAPTISNVTPGNGQATVSFTPGSDGGTPITSYTVTSSPGGLTAGGSNSPITVTGLTNGTSYTFTVTATNSVGTSPPSAPSSAAVPRTVPGAPTVSTVTPGNGQVSVSFSAPEDNGGAAITGYVVTSSPEGHDETGTTSPIVVTGLTNGTSYTFTVKAVNAAGEGPASPPSAAVVPRTVPDAPTGVTATPGNGQATVSFSAPAFDGGAAITRYRVMSSPGGFIAEGLSTQLTVSGLSNGTAYTFTVAAENAAGFGAASSPSNSVTPAAPPSPPTNLTATPGDGQLTVTWGAPVSDGGSPITSYTMTVSPGNQVIIGVTSPKTLSGLANGTTYTITVTASNGVSTSPAATTTGTPRTLPGAPTGVSATPADSLASVSFTPPASDGGAAISDYTVVASPGGATGHGTSSPIVVDGLANGTAYTFTVRATNAAGDGPFSSASSAVTPRTVPGAPTNAAATPGNGQATVSFTAPVSNGGAAITSYTVTSSLGGFMASGASSPITVTGLTNGVNYTFTVRATNVAGLGPSSQPSNDVTPGAPVVVPGAPTGAFGAAGNAQVTVSFTPPADDGGSAITSYTVTSNPGGITASGAASPIVVTGLTNGVDYTFTIKATNTAGSGPASAPSLAVRPMITLTAPGAPTAVTATAGIGSAVVTFTAPASDGGTGILSYTVTSNPGGITAMGASSPIVISGLTNNASYTFTVTATNGAGTGPASAPSSAVVPHVEDRTAPPDPPAPVPRPDVPAPPEPSPRKIPPHH